ncbi:hypothetical protein [Paraburkholderia tropica]|uniref:hypothetical protein n=1 Tax=Paraburkholderia tropica TaxID=92647 RepID=UPI002AAFC147|nr:hypothetical protein [Paraburkholderia tropica]
MPEQPGTGSIDEDVAAGKPRRLTLAGALVQRGGSCIRFGTFELEVVEIGPYRDRSGSVVTFLARPVGDTPLRPGEVIRTPWGICKVVK